MLYFILWAVFLLAVIVSVPVVHWLENKRRREAMPEQAAAADPAEGEAAEEDFASEDEFAAEEGFGEEEPLEMGGEELGGDDFSAFEEEFK